MGLFDARDLAGAKQFENDALQSGIKTNIDKKYLKFQEIATKARTDGYNAIKFDSMRGDGYNYVIYGESKDFFKEVLTPKMIMPAGN